MPKVWNKRDPNCPKDAVYIGRPSLYGNPFVIGKHGDRDQVIWRYKKEVIGEMTPAQLDLLKANLRGKDLVCWCKPAACHGDVLLEIANEA
jgi:hypothetical protein